MKAIVVAVGQGSRLMPLTNDIPLKIWERST